MAGSWTRFHILRVLGDGPTYPYQLARTVAESTRGQVMLEAGNLHRRLGQLCSEGLIEETSRPDDEVDRRRRYFRLSPAGRRELAANLDRMREAVRLSDAGAGSER